MTTMTTESATPSSASQPAPKLSVVIIGRNEQDFIGRAIESVLNIGQRLEGVEVIFADSASTDQSVQRASHYPIRILQLKKDWPLCVAAGRYTGYLHSHGEYVFFQDGDSEAEADWLVSAVGFLDHHPEYGAVAGVLDEVYLDTDGNSLGTVPNVFEQDLTKSVSDCKNLGGIALFRRRAMELAGPVNPHLPTAEDHELCMRIRNAGFKLARLEGRMAVKFTENRRSIREVLRRSRTKMYDYGAVIKHAGTYGGAIQFCVDAIPFVVSTVAALMAFFVVTAIAAWFGKLWIVAACVCLGAVVWIVKKGGLHPAGLSLAVRAVSTYRTVLSFFRTHPKPIEDYPTDAIQVR